MGMALEVATIAWHTLMWGFSVAAITAFVLVACGKLKVPAGRPPRRWQVAAVILATLLLAGIFLP